MSDVDGPLRQWLDDLSMTTRLGMIVAVSAIVIAVVVWG
jgi:hypothetical protein